MRAPYGLNILDNCLTCPMRRKTYLQSAGGCGAEVE